MCDRQNSVILVYMKRRYSKNSLNLSNTMKALETGAEIWTGGGCGCSIVGGTLSMDFSTGTLTLAPDARGLRGWPVDHKAVVALHRANKLVRVEEHTCPTTRRYTVTRWTLAKGGK